MDKMGGRPVVNLTKALAIELIFMNLKVQDIEESIHYWIQALLLREHFHPNRTGSHQMVSIKGE